MPLVPLPMEMEWPLAQRVQAVRRFTALLIAEWASRAMATTTAKRNDDSTAAADDDEALKVTTATRQFVHQYILARYAGLWPAEGGGGGGGSRAGGGGGGGSAGEDTPQTTGRPVEFSASWDAVRRACESGFTGRIHSDGGSSSSSSSSKVLRESWLTDQLAAKFRERAAATVDALDTAMPLPAWLHGGGGASAGAGAGASAHDDAATEDDSAGAQRRQRQRQQHRAQQALLLADHIDALTAVMLGADAAYPMMAQCYE